ncbi:Suppressor of the cold-sensitive snRNP biogenesis mutant brr1-1 [Sticta canariensis]|nr:Suppressor of the cold-sensitive snRNP biogenesis mutant brr1-1 [Sticta canariensis]
MVFLPRTNVGVLLLFISLALSLDASQQLMGRDEDFTGLGWVPTVVDGIEGAASAFGDFAAESAAQLGELTKGAVIPSLGSAGIDGLGGSVVDFIPGLPAPSFPTLPESPDLLPKIPPTMPPSPETPDDPETPKPASLPSLNTGCDQLPIGAPDDCDPRKSYIIYASSCGDEMGNEALTATFTTQYQLNPDEIGRDDDCGIIFWVARLSENKVAEVRATPGVRDIVLNGPTVFGGVPRPRGSTSVLSLEKRGDEVIGEQSWYDLGFISTPPGAAVVGEYLYFASGGDGVEVYVVDSGAAATSPEFDDKITKWLYSNRVLKSKTDEIGHGTCVASKVAGYIYGVAKGTSLRICKIASWIDSFLKSLLLILNDLKKRSAAGPSVAGHTVIMISTQWYWERGPNEEAAIRSLRKLITEYQAVVVMAAGNDHDGGEPLITRGTWPAAAYYEDLPIIIVGAVDLKGVIEPWSKTDASVAIYAPGSVRCASASGIGAADFEGTSFSAAEVAGLAAYLLPIVPSLRNSENIPRAVLDYLTTKASYARTGASVRSIWNRLYPDRGPPLYGWVS